MKTNGKTKRLTAVLLALFTMAALLTALPFSAAAETSGIYTYTVSGGEATITSCDSSASGAIIIPSTLGGCPVIAIGYSAFYDCDSLTAVTIPDSVTTIGDDAFWGCSSLTAVTIGDSVTTIGENAFFYCASLTAVTIPDSVTTIGNRAFSYCISLTAITVGKNNHWYTSEDGILFDKKKTKLICYPGGKSGSYAIPDSVTTIGDSAFSYCDSLTAVTIPDSVTTIGGSAFYNCGSLTTVTIPDSVTTIGDGAFWNCASLTTVTIPDSVTTIGGSAFWWCDSLTAITIGNSVTTIGYEAFCWCNSLAAVTIGSNVTTIGHRAFYNCDALTDVYYTGSERAWEKISIGSSNDDLLEARMHYNCVDKSDGVVSGKASSVKSGKTDELHLVIYENKNDSSKDSDAYQLSENAGAVNKADADTSDKKGSIILQNDGSDITVSKEGYITRTVTAARAEQAKKIYLQKDTGKRPIINAVWMGDTDIYTAEKYIDLLSTESVTLSAEVTWKGGTQSKMYLMQDARRAEFTGSSLTMILSDKFDVSKTIYIVAEDTEGNATKKKLKLKAGGGGNETMDDWNLSLGDSATGKIPGGIAGIEGVEVGLDFPFIPLTVTFEDNKFYAVLGLDIVKAEKEYSFEEDKNGKTKSGKEKTTKYLFENIKEGFKKSAGKVNVAEMKKKWKKAKSNYKAKVGFDADLTVLGYIEGYRDSDGNVSILDGGVIVNPSIEVSAGAPIFPAIPIVQWEAAVKGEIEAMLNLYLNEQAEGFTPRGSLGGAVTLSGGVLVGASGIAGGSGGLKGKLGVDWDIYPKAQDYVAISGEIGAYAKAWIGPLSFEKDFPFAEGIIWDHPSTRVKTLSLPKSVDLYSLQEYSLIDRGYAEAPSAFVANEQPVELSAFTPQSRIEKTLKTNVYTYSEPQITAFSDGTKLAVWVDDDTKRTDINRTALYYSFYNGSTWSTPMQLQNDGTADYSPHLANIDGTACIAWVNAKSALSGSASEAEIFSAWEIAAAVFDKESMTFKNIAALTDDTAIDTMPRVFGEDGEIYIAWVANTSGDVFATGNSYAVKTASLSSGGWNTPETYTSSLHPVDSLAAYMQDGSTYIAYAVDGDGNQADYTDKEIYLNKQQITSNTVLDSKPVFADGVLYYYENGSIIAYDLEEETAETACSGITNDRFTVLTDGVNRAIVYGGADGLVTELWGVMYDSESGKWGSPQAMTKLGADISSFAGSFTEDGKLQFIINKTKIIGTMDSAKPYGQTDLALLTVTPGYNLSLDDAVYHADRLLAGNTLEFYTTITNDGDLAVKDYKVEVLDGSGKMLATTYNEEAILPGQTVDFTAYYPLGDSTFSPHTVSLRLTAINTTEQNVSDNVLSMPLTYENIALENIDYGIDENGKAVIYADIVNRGYSAPGTITASLRRGSADGAVVDTVTVTETLDTLELAAINFTVPLQHGAVYYVTLDKEGENSDFVVLEAENNYLHYNSVTNEIVINSDAAIGNARVLVAAYTGEEMVAFRTAFTNVAAGETRLVSPLADFGKADKVRIMLWNSTGVTPLMDVLEFTP